MPDAKRALTEPEELVRSDLRGIVLLLVPGLIVGAVVASLGPGTGTALLFILLWVGIFAPVIVLVRWLVGRNAIFADDIGLIVVVRGRASRSHTWPRIVDASWDGGAFWTSWNPGAIVVTAKADDEGMPLATRKHRVGSVVIVRPGLRAKMGVRVELLLAKYQPRARS